ncbi:hypothetical protein FH972_024664 [Carpinus fangiana]|uniref:Glycine cleavage system H protein n=1 Tax=Carpinus fangiana TaxID=176857 RepID=A0A5N6KZ59_9ROSI|nr:hypothetical protein FH972_024664 [Carpinus fangiana]
MASRTVLSAVARSVAPRLAIQGGARNAVAVAARPAYPTRSFASASRLAAKRFTEDHEWIDYDESSKKGKVGITEYAANALGDVVYVELPAVDTEVSAGDAVGAVESVKSASDILTPVSGKVVGINSTLEEKPATINKSPEQDGWIVELELTDAAELESLMDEAKYKSFTEELGDDH